MTNHNFASLFDAPPLFDSDDQTVVEAICRTVPGYSTGRQYSFFRSLFATTNVRRILVLGVYFGRDIVYMLKAGRRTGKDIEITGVDKFSDDACADWPPALRGFSWPQAGFGLAPSLQAAVDNVTPFLGEAQVRLIRQDDEAFLLGCREQFDLIYLDTAHDYATVCRQLRQALPLLAAEGLLAGDDYTDKGMWAVRSPLTDVAPGHRLFYDWIWVAAREHVVNRTGRSD